MDFEWNADLDTGAKKVTSNNFLANVHEGDLFAGLSYARLNAPGRSYSDGIPSSVSNSRQIRLLAGYGTPTKPGLSIAANANLDLNLGTIQYEAIQSAYNWNCCGFSLEYGRYNLGAVRDESVWRYSITLKNIITAGNLNRAASLF
jgi:LPS-assembly protein